MNFTWDEKKRRANILTHGFDFVDAKTVFEGITFTLEDDRFDYGEERFITLGLPRGTGDRPYRKRQRDSCHFHEEGNKP